MAQALLADDDDDEIAAPVKDQARIEPSSKGSILPHGEQFLDAPDSAPLFTGLSAIEHTRAAAENRIEAGIERSTQADAYRMHKAFNAEAATAEDIPTWDEQAQRAKYHTDPIRAFGSLGSVFAMVASAFTHRPMINALQGSAAAMEAVRAGDRQAYEDAYKAWKDNSELAIRRHNLQHQEFEDAARLMQTDLEAGEIAMKNAARKFGDQKMLFLLDNGYNKEAFELMEQRAKAMTGLEAATQSTTIFKLQEQAYKTEMARIEKMQKPAEMSDEEWTQRQTAQKLWASVRIFGDQGKLTPINSLMLQHVIENPNETAEQRAAFFARIQNSGHRTTEESAAVDARARELQEEAQTRGEILPAGQAIMQAEAEWSEARGTAAATRAKLAQESQDRRAQLSADTRLAVASLSADTRREITEMIEGGKDARSEFSTKAKAELAKMNAQARRELEEFLEVGRNARAKLKGTGIVTKERQAVADVNAQIEQEIAAGKLDPNNAEAVRKRRAQLEAETADESGKSKNLTAPESNVVTMAPTALKNMSKILGLIDQSGNLITHVPTSLVAEYGGEGDGIAAYNITRRQLEYDLLRMNAGGVLSAKAMHAVLDLLPPGSAALNFKRAAFQTEFANMREEIQDKVNQIEAQGKRIDPNIWETLKSFGVYPSAQRQESLIERFRTNPASLSRGEFQTLLRLPYLRSEDVEAIARYIQEQANKSRAEAGSTVTGH